MERKLEGTGNYLQFACCTLGAAKQNEEPQDGTPSSKRKPVEAYLYIKTKNKPLKMANNTSTDVIFTGAWCDRMIAKH